MALPPADPRRHRRQQLRRALIGWIGGAGVLALLILAGILGGDERTSESDPISAHAVGFFDMTSDEFDQLHTGETENAVLERLGKPGSPEGDTPIEIVSLFPSHDDSVSCSYWLISDADETAARLCFSRPGSILRQKLERQLSPHFESEDAIRA